MYVVKNLFIQTLKLWVFAFSCFTALHAHADFIKSSSLSWIANTAGAGTAGVTVLPVSGGNNHPIGLVIFSSTDRIAAQSFHPSKLQSDKSVSCFLRYSPEKHAFTELLLPFGKKYSIDGNVTIRIGQALRVSISTENGMVPYVSVIHESDPRSILAFLGTDVVITGSGARLEGYLDAGARNTTEVFEIRHQDLYLQGIKFSETKIGLPNQSTQSNTCLTKGVIIASNAQFVELQKGTVPYDIKKQLQAIQKGEDLGILQKYTILNVLSPGLAVALDGYGKPDVIIEKDRVLDVPLCTINELPLT